MTDSKPNILLLMADQLTASALSLYGNQVCQTPNLSRLASGGILFENAYCNFPLCGPARYALLSGQLASHVGGYDNACEFAAATPTLPYYLSALGYQTSLIGKMHFVGPDQLHGYHERLTTDIYPSDFGWTPDWLINPPHGPAGMSMRSVVEAGLCTRSLQFDFDDEVAYKTIQKIHDLSRSQDKRPFFLTASFTHPHNVTDEDVRTARHAYYANISYVDDQIGHILSALKATGQDQNTIIIFTSDHGEMLGERGLWYKYTLLEPALKVPLIVHVPGLAPRRVSELVSHVDLLPTLHELASPGTAMQAVDALDGSSFASLLEGQVRPERDNIFAAEFTAEGSVAPMVVVRKGNYKLIVSLVDVPQLFDLARDPLEMQNLAGKTETAHIEADLQQEVSKRWNLDDLNSTVLSSQKRRRWIQQQLSEGDRPAWDFQPFTDASKQFVRGGKQSSPTLVKGLARFPFVRPKSPDTPRDPS